MRCARPIRSLAAAAAVLAVLPAAASAATAHRDLSYDRDTPPPADQPRANLLDLYLPDGVGAGDRAPLVVYVHGGGWRVGDKANRIADKARLFTEAGWAFASVNYRLSPRDIFALDPGRVMFPDHPADVAEAVGWLARHAREHGLDRKRILLVGHSAGAHLASLVATDAGYLRANAVVPWQVIGVVALDTGAFDVPARIAGAGPLARALFHNAFGTPAENAARDLWWPASPIAWAGRRDPRHLIVTQAGSASRISESHRMASALGQDPATAVVALPYDHEQINLALGAADDPAGETARVMGFAAERLRRSQPLVTRLVRRPPKRVRLGDGRRRATVRFRFRAGGEVERYECALDARKLRRCSRSKRFRVGAGKHRLRVRAIAVGGRPGKLVRYRFSVIPGRR